MVPHDLIIDDQSYADGIDMEPGEFYRILRENHVVPTTSSPPPARFLEAYKKAAAGAESVVCITVSSNFSATYESAFAAAEMAREQMGDLGIRVVDSTSAAGAAGLLALEGARLAHDGGDLDEVTSRLGSLIPGLNLLAFLDTLYYLSRSGRVPRVAAWAGSLLGIKPVTELRSGEARLLEKPRSRARATQRILQVMKDRVGDRPLHANVMHAEAADDARALCERVESEFSCREMFVSEFTPVMGAHLGPGLLGVAFYAEGAEGQAI